MIKVVALSSLFFLMILLDVIFDGLLTDIDKSIYRLSLDWHTSTIDSIFFAITKIGNLSSILMLSIIVTLILIWQRDRVSILFYWVGILGSLALFAGIKELMARTRPSNNIGDIVEMGYSFPSGHATMSMSFVLLVIYIYYDKVSTIYKTPLVLFGLLFTLSITFSRLYLGLHYLSDLLAGLMLGVFWTTFIFSRR
jgi:undecaprenyl-diphosphatase